MPTPSDVTLTDGSLSFDGGVDSLATTTIASEANPNGLKRNQLAWLNNGSVRDGGISPRAGWQPIGTFHAGDAIYQGGAMYDPDGEHPYPIVSVGGILYAINPDTAAATDLTGGNPLLANPPAETYGYFCQGEEFLIIQAGDNVTLPLFWDGALLRRSLGLLGAPHAELPAATAMDYYMGRLWYAQGRQYTAGDIVGNTSSGTAPYNFRDSILKVTENPMAIGGDGFLVPSASGNIRALKHGAAIDVAMGEGRLFIFTRRNVYALQVPVTRTNWIAAGYDNQPLQTVVQFVNGSVNDRSVAAANGDLYYQSLEPGIRSLLQAVRYFQTPGNRQISANEQRLLQFSDRSLLRFGSGIEFNNRMLQTALPKQLASGVVSQAIAPMDFIPISGFGQEHLPNWEGMYEGLDILQLFTGDFGGRQRAFAVTVSRVDGAFQLWELTQADRFENGDNRITWVIEFPSYTWGDEFKLKKLVSLELWIDRLYGSVDFNLEYRPDGETCWLPWHRWEECCPRTSCEDHNNPICYPLLAHGESYRSTRTVPLPPPSCQTATGRPSNVGYQFQPRLTIKGYCRLRGVMLHAQPMLRELYAGLTC